MISPLLFTPPDFYDAHRTWKANCGPSTFAALRRRSLAHSQRFFRHFPKRTYTTTHDMRTALLDSGATISRRKVLPKYGALLIVWRNEHGKQLHWVACAQIERRVFVYDCNAIGRTKGSAEFTFGAWQSLAMWERHVMREQFNCEQYQVLMSWDVR